MVTTSRWSATGLRPNPILQAPPLPAVRLSQQRFSGKLGERHGTFVLQGTESIEDGKIRATWFVVPKSGTGDLTGLRGEGGFEGVFGKGSDGTLDGTLDYRFE